MTAVLTDHSYGKSRIRLTKVTRRADRHDVRELSIDIALEGDFDRSYTEGDNRLVIPTDTMKNVAFALAKEHPLESIEDFAAVIAGHFLDHHAHVSDSPRADRRAAARPHSHRRPRPSPRLLRLELRMSHHDGHATRDGLYVESGLDDLFLLKSTGSAFCGFLTDRYTTLKDAPDRILATMLDASWLYQDQLANWNDSHAPNSPVLARDLRSPQQPLRPADPVRHGRNGPGPLRRGREDHAHHAQQASHPRRFETIRPRQRKRNLRRDRRALRLDHRHGVARDLTAFLNGTDIARQTRQRPRQHGHPAADVERRRRFVRPVADPCLHGMKIIPVGAPAP